MARNTASACRQRRISAIDSLLRAESTGSVRAGVVVAFPVQMAPWGYGRRLGGGELCG